MKKYVKEWVPFLSFMVIFCVAVAVLFPEPKQAEAQVGTASTRLVLDYFFSDTLTIANAASAVVRFPKKSSGALHRATTGATSQSVAYANIAYDPALTENTIRIKIYSRDCPGGTTEHVNRAGESSVWLPSFSSGIDSITIFNGSVAPETFSVWGLR